MYIATIPNRHSPPAILLRESYREGKQVKSRTLANLNHWPPARVEALRRALRGELDGVVGSEPTSDRIFGVLFVLKQLADRVGLTKVLGQDERGKLALFLVLARLAHQGSRLSAVRWAQEHAVAEVLGLGEFDENHLYATLDWLAAHQEPLEDHLYRTYVKQTGTAPVLVLYDVTSTYLEGACNELAAFGYNRDGKRGTPQLVIGLLTAADGEPLAIRVFAGNTSDPQTVTMQVSTLKERFRVEEVVFVGDRGMIKTKGKGALTAAQFKYITALTKPQIRKLMGEGVLQPDLFDTTAQAVAHDGKRLILRCNDVLQQKRRHCRDSQLQRLQELVNERNAVVSRSKRAQPAAGWRTLSSWIQRHQLHTFVPLALEGRLLHVIINDEAKVTAGLLDGCYVLETDVRAEQLDTRTVDERYRDLQRVERDFRNLKTVGLEVRPIFLRKAARTRGHVFVAMLALKLLRALAAPLQQAFGTAHDEPYTLTVEAALATLSRLCLLRYGSASGDVVSLPRLDERQRALFEALQIRPPVIHSVAV